MCSIELKSLFPPPDPDAPENILNKLNDDCLREIFSSSNLDVWDLLQIAGVCRRFKPIAKSVFKAKFKHFEGQGEIIRSDWPFEQLVKTFGKSIVSFGSTVLNDDECGLVSCHCPNIKELKCRITDQETIDDFRDLFVRLKTLNISSKSRSLSMAKWSGADVQLEALTIPRSSCYNMQLPQGNLPRLVKLDYDFITLYDVGDFFRDNPQLEHITLSPYYVYGSAPDYSRISLLPDLQVLKLAQNLLESDSLRQQHDLWGRSLVPVLRDIPEIMERACDELKIVSYSYAVDNENFDDLPNENEVDAMDRIAKRRDIDLKLSIVLQPDEEEQNIVAEFLRLYHHILRRHKWISFTEDI